MATNSGARSSTAGPGGSAESWYPHDRLWNDQVAFLHESPALRLDLANRHGIVDFNVDNGGNLTGRKLVASSGSPSLDSAVMTAIAAAAPYPARPNGSPVSLNYNFGKSAELNKNAQINMDTPASAAPARIVPSVPPPVPAVGQPATAPASADTVTAPATPTDRFIKVLGVADNTLVIGHCASTNPDCTSSGKTFVRIISSSKSRRR